MATFKVTPAELRTAATKINQEAQTFETAAKSANTAANNLAAQWEGDAQKAFVDEQTKANTWYTNMAQKAREYADHLNKAATQYEDAEAKATQEVKKQ